MFKLKNLKTGDKVFVQGSAVIRVTDTELNSDPDKTYVLFLAMEGNDGNMCLMNATLGVFSIKLFTMSDIGAIHRDGEILFPKAELTAEERAFLLSLKPILKPSTRLIKFQSLGGLNEHIALIDVKTILKDRENVHLPTFKANSMYRGLAANEEYTLDSLGIFVEEEE